MKPYSNYDSRSGVETIHFAGPDKQQAICGVVITGMRERKMDSWKDVVECKRCFTAAKHEGEQRLCR